MEATLTLAITVLIAIIPLVIGVGLYLLWRRDGSQQAGARFGAEYERAVQERGRRRGALDPALRHDYIAEWGFVQSRFVDEPASAVVHAQRLVKSVMRARGYPMDDVEQRAAGISVDDPEIVEDYRAASAITEDSHAGRASTEQLRGAMMRYRSLLSRLLDIPEKEPRSRIRALGRSSSRV